MKIVFNTDQIYLHGGIEKVMATKANYWVGIPNVQVYIVTTEQQKNIPRYFLDKRVNIIDLGVNYNRSKSYFSKENLLKAFIHLKKQKEFFRKLQPNVIISPNFNFDHYWLPFIKKDSRLIKERHSSRYKEPEARKNKALFNRLKFKFNDWLDSKYTKIVVLNEDERKYVMSNNAVVIPNPIESQIMQADLINKRVLAAGRISQVKGFDHLIKAWAIVNDSFSDWHLDIYGQDYLDTQKELEQLIQDLQLQDVIHFKGSIDNIPEKMTEYSIYAMTSQTECFPMVLLEALSVGLPIVSYDCPNGPRNIIQDKIDGLLIQDQNIQIFADSLKELILDKGLRIKMGNNAKENIHRFTTFEVMKKWKSLLNLPNV